MTIRKQILTHLLAVTLLITSVSFTVIFLLFKENREEEFQMQQKDKILYTIKLLAEYRDMSERIANMMDELTLHDFYDEKMLVFNHQKEPVFSSIDDLTIPDYAELLQQVSPENPWYETRQNKYDVVVLYHTHQGQHYYAISKAFDAYGYSKLLFLRNILLITFFFIVVCMIWVAHFVSTRIALPINRLAQQIQGLELDKQEPLPNPQSFTAEEINILASQFNELLNRTYQAINYRKHAIHHVSHQLKTPIAILVNELEKLQQADQLERVQEQVPKLVEKTKSLGAILQSLLELSKIDSGQNLPKQPVRVDELIFDIEQELQIMNPHSEVQVRYNPSIPHEQSLVLNANEILLKQALHNLLSNCIAYSSNQRAQIEINTSNPGQLILTFSNTGPAIKESERPMLFKQFFRGTNSQGKSGFGIGLVLTHRILQTINAQIDYVPTDPQTHVFKVVFLRT